MDHLEFLTAFMTVPRDAELAFVIRNKTLLVTREFAEGIQVIVEVAQSDPDNVMSVGTRQLFLALGRRLYEAASTDPDFRGIAAFVAAAAGSVPEETPAQKYQSFLMAYMAAPKDAEPALISRGRGLLLEPGFRQFLREFSERGKEEMDDEGKETACGLLLALAQRLYQAGENDPELRAIARAALDGGRSLALTPSLRYHAFVIEFMGEPEGRERAMVVFNHRELIVEPAFADWLKSIADERGTASPESAERQAALSVFRELHMSFAVGYTMAPSLKQALLATIDGFLLLALPEDRAPLYGGLFAAFNSTLELEYRDALLGIHRRIFDDPAWVAWLPGALDRLADYSGIDKVLEVGESAFRASNGATGPVLTISRSVVEWAKGRIDVSATVSARCDALEGSLRLHHALYHSPAELEEIIALLERGVQAFSFERTPEEWAYVEADLAEAYIQRISGDRAENIETALQHFNNLTSIWTRESAPEKWAATQAVLANAYRERVRGERRDNIEQAIRCGENASELLVRSEYPEAWGILQMNLGAAYVNRLTGERGQNVEDAIECFKGGLEVLSIEAHPNDWAKLNANLGSAYEQRLMGDRSTNLELAIHHGVEACRIWTEESSLLDWATAQNNLGSAFRERVEGDAAENIEVAVACYERALKVVQQENAPLLWAHLMAGLATALGRRQVGNRWENIEQAVKHLSEVAGVIKTNSTAHEFAMLQHNLGNLFLQRLAGERRDNIENALSCFRAAASEWTREESPYDWAQIQMALAQAYFFRLAGSPRRNLDEAIEHCERSMEVRTRETAPRDWARAQETLSTILMSVAQEAPEQRDELEERALRCLLEAEEVLTIDAYPHEWAGIKLNLGNLYQQKHRDDLGENIEQAIECYQKAIEVSTPKNAPYDWAKLQHNLAGAYFRRVVGNKDENFNAANVHYRRAAWGFAVAGDLEHLSRSARAAGTLHLDIGTSQLSREGGLQEAYHAFLLSMAAAYAAKEGTDHPLEQFRLQDEAAEAAVGAAHCAALLGDLRAACALFDMAKGSEFRDHLRRDPRRVLDSLPASEREFGELVLRRYEEARWAVYGAAATSKDALDAEEAKWRDITSESSERFLATARRALPEIPPIVGLKKLESGLMLGGWLGQAVEQVRKVASDSISRDLELDGSVRILFNPGISMLVKVQAELWFTGMPGIMPGIGAVLASPPEPRLAVILGVSPWGTHIITIRSGVDRSDERRVTLQHWSVSTTEEQWLELLTEDAEQSADGQPRGLQSPAELAVLLYEELGFPSMGEIVGDGKRIVIVPHRLLHYVPWSHLPLSSDPEVLYKGPYLSDRPVSILPALFVATELSPRGRTRVDRNAGRVILRSEGARRLTHHPEFPAKPPPYNPVHFGWAHAAALTRAWQAAPRSEVEEFHAGELREFEAEPEQFLEAAARSNILALFGHGLLHSRWHLMSGFLLPGGDVLTVEKLHGSLNVPNGEVATVLSCWLGTPLMAGSTASDPLASVPWALLQAGFLQVVAGDLPVNPIAGILVAGMVHEHLATQAHQGQPLDAASALCTALRQLRALTATELLDILHGWKRTLIERKEGLSKGGDDGGAAVFAAYEADQKLLEGNLAALKAFDPSGKWYESIWAEHVPLVVYGL